MPGDEQERTAPSGAVFMYRMYGMPRAQGTGTVPDSSSISSIHGGHAQERRCTGCTVCRGRRALEPFLTVPAFPPSMEVMRRSGDVSGCTGRKLLLRFRHFHHPWRSADNRSLRDLHFHHPWRSADNRSLRDLHFHHPWRSPRAQGTGVVGVGVKWGRCWENSIAWNSLIPFPVAVWVEFDSDPFGTARHNGGYQGGMSD